MITAEEILARVSLRDAMEAIERAFIALGKAEVGEPVSLGMTLADGTFHVKACAGTPAYANILAVKLNANFPANRERHGLPTIQGVVAAFDAGNGKLLALLDSPSITSLRTASDEIVLFDSTGLAVEDLAVCALLLGEVAAPLRRPTADRAPCHRAPPSKRGRPRTSPRS